MLCVNEFCVQCEQSGLLPQLVLVMIVGLMENENAGQKCLDCLCRSDTKRHLNLLNARPDGPAQTMLLPFIFIFAPSGAPCQPSLLTAGCWKDYSESVPAFLTMIGIPLSYSIADGLALGFIS